MSMYQSHITNLILESFEQPENEALQQQVRDWIAESKENQQFYQQLERVWKKGFMVTDSEYDVEAEKGRFWQSVEEKEDRRRGRQIKKAVWGIAASVIVLLGMGVAWKIWLAKPEQLLVRQTMASQMDSLVLPDGSRVFLNGLTELRYREEFTDGEQRELWLDEGEIFVEAAEDMTHPFVVHMDNCQAQVLGTSFDVKQRAEVIGVSVATGKVRFSAKGEQASRADLTEGMAGVTKPGTGVIRVAHDNGNMDAWRTGKMRFDNTPLPSVFLTLEGFYGIHISASNEVKDKRWTATITELSKEKLIKALEISMDLKFIKTDSVSYKVESTD